MGNRFERSDSGDRVSGTPDRSVQQYADEAVGDIDEVLSEYYKVARPPYISDVLANSGGVLPSAVEFTLGDEPFAPDVNVEPAGNARSLWERLLGGNASRFTFVSGEERSEPTGDLGIYEELEIEEE